MNLRLFFAELAYHRNVACLGSLGALFDIELDLLSLLQVTISIALNGGEMDEDVLSTFALDEAEGWSNCGSGWPADAPDGMVARARKPPGLGLLNRLKISPIASRFARPAR